MSITDILFDAPEDELEFTVRMQQCMLDDLKMIYGIQPHDEMQNIVRGEFRNWLAVVYALRREKKAGNIRYYRVKNRDISVRYPGEDTFVDVEWYFDDELIEAEGKKYETGELKWDEADDDFFIHVSFIKFRRKVQNV